MPEYRTRLLAAHACWMPPLDEVVRRLVAHIREFRPEVIVTHDAFGGLTGHPDHVHTYRVTLLAAQAAGLAPLHPDAGAPWRPSSLLLATHPHSVLPNLRSAFGARRSVHTVPDEQVTISLDVSPWLDTKLTAIAAHRTEVDARSTSRTDREPCPGCAGEPPRDRVVRRRRRGSRSDVTAFAGVRGAPDTPVAPQVLVCGVRGGAATGRAGARSARVVGSRCGRGGTGARGGWSTRTHRGWSSGSATCPGS